MGGSPLLWGSLLASCDAIRCNADTPRCDQTGTSCGRSSAGQSSPCAGTSLPSHVSLKKAQPGPFPRPHWKCTWDFTWDHFRFLSAGLPIRSNKPALSQSAAVRTIFQPNSGVQRLRMRGVSSRQGAGLWRHPGARGCSETVGGWLPTVFGKFLGGDSYFSVWKAGALGSFLGSGDVWLERSGIGWAGCGVGPSLRA